MAAYAALVSLMNSMKQILNHRRLSTCFDKKQMESLHRKAGFLLDFIESYNSHDGGSKEGEDLESHIASAAHAAEDVIESHIVDQILAGSTSNQEKDCCFSVDLNQVIEDMDSTKKIAMKFKVQRELRNQLPAYSKPATSSRPLTTGKNAMVGFENELIQVMERLIGQQSNRQIISIVGMAGIGKTTLARNVYEHSVIVQHFDVRVWATISQEYSVKEILLELLSCQRKPTSETVFELGEQLHKSLSGMRYLIIVDDMWGINIWDEIKFFIPDNHNRSRIVITTRLSNMAIYFSSSSFVMNFLDEDKSWKLFCEKTFGQEDCPPELVKIGKKIVEQCKGLPLSIVVIAGLLRKSYKIKEYWQDVAKNMKSILNSGENEQVLSLSYYHLPAHLKPCFLYMGTFPADCEIRVSRLTKLWVAEGFLKPNGAQILEEVAEGYLKDLVDRNLILVDGRRANGKIRSCRIHDLLRDLCLRIAKKEKFFYDMKAYGISQAIDTERRLVYHYGVFHGSRSASLARSIICEGVKLPDKFRLLRVLHRVGHRCSLETIFRNVNLRYLAYRPWSVSKSMLSSSIYLIWNLQTLIIRGVFELIVAPVEIWMMPQLRHLECDKIYLPDPPFSDQQDDFFVLGNLRTLKTVVNFRLSEEACKRIPNINKLHIIYGCDLEGYDHHLYHFLSNLGRLHKLESLNINIFFHLLPHLANLLKENFMFPNSLKKLSLTSCRLCWEDLTLIGSLPQLEVLKLEKNSVVGSAWNLVKEKFLRLKFLRIERCDLISWTADSSHFPVLEKLVLIRLWRLNEIPWGIGELPTLVLIHLDHCTESATISAMKIREEQDSLGNYGLQIQVKISPLSRSFWARLEIEGLTINGIQLEEDPGYLSERLLDDLED